MDKKNTKRKKYSRMQLKTIFTAVITSFITTFMGSALNLSIPAISKDFGASAQEVAWVVTVYMLTCAALAVSIGKAADRIERSIILKLGIVVFAGASAAAAFSQAMWVLLLFRFVQGVGAAMIFATNIALLVSVFDEAERGRVLGYASCATYVGLSLGPVLGGILNARLGWRSVFIAAAVVALSAFLSAMLKGREKSKSGRREEDRRLTEKSGKEGKKGRFDWKGSLLFTVAISLTMYALSSLKTDGDAPFFLALGLLLFIALLHSEKRAEDSLINTGLFREKLTYTFANFAALISYGSIFAISYLMSVYLQLIKGFSSQSAGFVLLASTAVIAVFSPLFGRISDRHSPQRMSALGMVLCSSALVGLIFISQETKLMSLILLLALSGFGFSLFASPNTSAVMACVKKEDYSSASAVLATMRSAGHTLSMAIVTLIMGIFMDGEALGEAEPATIIQIMRISFIVFTSFCILGIFMARYRKM